MEMWPKVNPHLSFMCTRAFSMRKRVHYCNFPAYLNGIRTDISTRSASAAYVFLLSKYCFIATSSSTEFSRSGSLLFSRKHFLTRKFVENKKSLYFWLDFMCIKHYYLAEWKKNIKPIINTPLLIRYRLFRIKQFKIV